MGNQIFIVSCSFRCGGRSWLKGQNRLGGWFGVDDWLGSWLVVDKCLRGLDRFWGRLVVNNCSRGRFSGYDWAKQTFQITGIGLQEVGLEIAGLPEAILIRLVLDSDKRSLGINIAVLSLNKLALARLSLCNVSFLWRVVDLVAVGVAVLKNVTLCIRGEAFFSYHY